MPQPPPPREEPWEDKLHGHTRIDEFRWLQRRGHPEVLAHLEAENRYAVEVMAHTLDFQERLYREMRARIVDEESSVPYERDGWSYATRYLAGLEHPVHVRRAIGGGPEQVVLDLNKLARGRSSLRLGSHSVSPDGGLVAYAEDSDGSELHTIRFRDISSGEILGDAIGGAGATLEWAEAGGVVFYTVLDTARRPCRVLAHTVGTDPRSDREVLREEDPAYYIVLEKTRSRAFVVVQIHSKVTTEAWLIDARRPELPPRLVARRAPGVEYSVDHQGERLLVLTNDRGANFRLASAPLASPGSEHWTELIPAKADEKLDAVDAFAAHVVVRGRRGGSPILRLLDPRTLRSEIVEIPEAVYSLELEPQPSYASRLLRFSVSTPISTRTVWELDMESGERRVLKKYAVGGGHDESRYSVQRIWVRAADGVRVPVSLAYRGRLDPGAPRPMHLLGYGAYGISLDAGFRSERLSLLDRGVVLAIAHVRGGGELGRSWYESGRLLAKRNTVTDFIAVAEALIQGGWTSPRSLVIEGRSAGGILVGAAINDRPDLFHAAIAEVPFVDVLNTMLDASLPLTVMEYDEWGNPERPEYYESIRSYSPYDNVRRQPIPHLLITAGLNDPRVQYWEPAKWAARLRRMKVGDSWLLLRTEMEAGHQGSSGRYRALRETAFKYAFILDRLGLD